MARKLGGPLLCVGDLLADLSHEDDDNDYNHEQRPSSTFPQSPQTLHQIFEKNYKDLNVALKNSGDSWIGLTQKICTALKAADKLVQTSHVELEQLSKKIHTLENILKRGDSACQNFKLMEEQNSLS